MGLVTPPFPLRFTDHLIFPVARSMAWPMTSLPPVDPKGGYVSRNKVSPATAMPPCPSSGSVPVQRMFWLVATLQVVGAPSTFTRKVPSGPPAWGQLARSPSIGGGAGPVVAASREPSPGGSAESACPGGEASVALVMLPPLGAPDGLPDEP